MCAPIIQTPYLSKIHLGWPKMSKYPKEISAFLDDAPLTGLFSVSAMDRKDSRFDVYFILKGLVKLHRKSPL